MNTLNNVIPKVSFKEVHAELGQESLFLMQDRDYSLFQKKADFLKGLGFTSSIATRLYDSLASNNYLFQRYANRYVNAKFIIKEQLERLCHKYNLYVRDLDFYSGDIPEKNINDMINFELYAEDIRPLIVSGNGLTPRYVNAVLKYRGPDRGYYTTDRFNWEMWYNLPRLNEAFLMKEFLKVAAVKDLFLPSAFEVSEARIIENEIEVRPLMQVDVDPIVLLEVNGGYLIITAWGDEANDELVFRERQN